jgi:hypothetical protein
MRRDKEMLAKKLELAQLEVSITRGVGVRMVVFMARGIRPRRASQRGV